MAKNGQRAEASVLDSAKAFGYGYSMLNRDVTPRRASTQLSKERKSLSLRAGTILRRRKSTIQSRNLVAIGQKVDFSNHMICSNALILAESAKAELNVTLERASTNRSK